MNGRRVNLRSRYSLNGERSLGDEGIIASYLVGGKGRVEWLDGSVCDRVAAFKVKELDLSGTQA
jgi:hypothetical protein